MIGDWTFRLAPFGVFGKAERRAMGIGASLRELGIVAWHGLNPI
jgi:hypothetical protein